MRLARKFTIILLFLVNVTAFSQTKSLDIEYVKASYAEALEDESTARALFDLLEETNSEDPLIISYQGGMHAIMCLYVSNPVKQLKMAKRANKLLNTAVDLDPKNIEIRFMRLAFGSKVPKFLGYSKHVEDDKAFVLKHLMNCNLPNDGKRGMVEFMVEEKIITSSECQVLLAKLP